MMKILFVYLSSLLMLINCTSTQDKIIYSDNLKIEQPTLNININPYKLKADFSNDSIETSISRDYFVGFSNDPGTNDNFFRRTVSIFTSTILPFYDIIFFPFPHVRKFRRDLNEFIAGDTDLVESAISKAIKDNNGDGFYLTNAKITESGLLWYWKREATIQGKLIKFSPVK